MVTTFRSNKSFLPPKEVISWLGSFLADGAMVSVRSEEGNSILVLTHLSSGDVSLAPISKSEIQKEREVVDIYDPRRCKKQTVGEWVELYRSHSLVVCEEGRHHEETINLRAGLKSSEKKESIRYIRSILELLQHADEGLVSAPEASLTPVFDLPATVGVALWVEGRLRGSAIHSSDQLKEAFSQATIAAARHAHYKPLFGDEFKECTVEVTLIKDPGVVISNAQLGENIIDANKAYYLTTPHKTGWLLPEVLNIRIFGSLRGHLETLAAEKASLTEAERKKVRVQVFETDNFVAPPAQEAPLELFGAVPRKREWLPNTEYFSREKMFEQAAQWLVDVQDTRDGSFPAVINPVTDRVNMFIQWPRMAMTLQGLVAYAISRNQEQRYCTTIKKALAFLEQNLQGQLHYMSSSDLYLARVYLGHIYAEHGEYERASNVTQALLAESYVQSVLLGEEGSSPIPKLQIASLMVRCGPADGGYLHKAKEVADQLYDTFYNYHNKGIDLVAYAELPCVYHRLSVVLSESAKSDAVKKYEELSRLYISSQHDDGSFPAYSNGSFSQTRAVGKILEVLALDPRNASSVERGLRWLETMQYTPTSSFFTSPQRRVPCMGGFRYGYTNYELWADAVGHVLLCASRLHT